MYINYGVNLWNIFKCCGKNLECELIRSLDALGIFFYVSFDFTIKFDISMEFNFFFINVGVQANLRIPRLISRALKLTTM
jgi:hypothetical protein